MVKRWLPILLCLLAGMFVPASSWAANQKQILFSGTASSNGSIYVQTRDGGTPLYTTSAAPVSIGDTNTEVRDAVEFGWRVGGCVPTNSLPGIVIYEEVAFTVWGSTNGISFNEITPGTPFVAHGITISTPDASSASVPTLGEWGLILLAGTILGAGAWTLQRRRRQRLPV